MERSAWTVGKMKFTRLPQPARHRLFAELAADAGAALAEGEEAAWERFLERYRAMQAWSPLDRYRPPAWLTPSEALEEYAAFHNLFGAPRENEGPLVEPGPAVSWVPRFPVAVALDQVRSPYNAGSVLRLADNFGFEGLVHATPWLRLDHPRLRRAARGCEHWIPVRLVEDLPAWLELEDRPVIGVEGDPRGVPLQEWAPPESAVLALGNESYGLAEAVRARCSAIVSIPMQGFKRSMNVHHALALVAWRITMEAAPGT